jgi:riboflavin kinase/FMN adenylyltransferase
METIRHVLEGGRAPSSLPAGTAACIGAFDGLHLGHQALLDEARRLAGKIAVVTFDPHPSQVLAPTNAPPLLQTPAQRQRTCAFLGVDELVLLPFDHGIASHSPDEFVRRFITEGLRPAAVVVGHDFRFGRDRAGGVEDLRRDCEAASIGFSRVARIDASNGSRISSTLIRDLVESGEVAGAAQLLGRWYSVEGSVRRGAARGRKLGYPTANIASENPILPPSGVYATVLCVVDPTSEHHGKRWASVANIGSNPTFADGAATTTGLEVHALDVDLGETLYERRLEVGFVARLRDELKFTDGDELTRAIEADIVNARPMLDAAALARLPGPIKSEPAGG